MKHFEDQIKKVELLSQQLDLLEQNPQTITIVLDEIRHDLISTLIDLTDQLKQDPVSNHSLLEKYRDLLRKNLR